MRKSKEIASLMKMHSTLKVPYCIKKCTLAIIYSNSFSHCKVDQKKTVAISQMFNHVQLHVHWMHLLNTRICRYTCIYITPTVQTLYILPCRCMSLKWLRTDVCVTSSHRIDVIFFACAFWVGPSILSIC